MLINKSSYRFIIDNDGYRFYRLFNAITWEKDIENDINEIPSNVTTVTLCPGASNFWVPLKNADFIGNAPELREFVANGNDPFLELLKGLKKRNFEVLLSIRMNDVHNPQEEWNLPRIRRLYKNITVEKTPSPDNWMEYCLDYSHIKVRNYMLKIIRELNIRYGKFIDGMMLDWMRFPRNLSGRNYKEVWKKREFLTQFNKQVRQIIGSKTFAVRVPSSIKGCKNIGIDLGDWNKYLDFIVVSPFLTTDFFIDIEEFKKVVKNKIPIYAGSDFKHASRPHCPESLRMMILSWRQCGADGFFLFNFPCWRERLLRIPWEWIKDLSSFNKMKKKPLLYSITNSQFRNFPSEMPGLLPIELKSNEHRKLNFQLPDLKEKRLYVEIKSENQVSMKFNSTIIRLQENKSQDFFIEYKDENLKQKPWLGIIDGLNSSKNILEFYNPSKSTTTISSINFALI